MKQAKLTKKLLLNKETVADLTSRAMGKIQAGAKTDPTCLICDTVYSCYVTQCNTCYHTCPATWCDTECGC